MNIVAQEQVQLSTAPVWENDSLHSRSVVLRTYVVNTGTAGRRSRGVLCASPKLKVP